MNLKEQVLKKMHELDIRPKKSLGQNFLISEHVVNEIFKCARELNPKFIIEVGPGLGVLTESLIQLDIPHKLIEMDRKIFAYWISRGEVVLEMDALKYDWQNWEGPEDSLLLSNLPYQIGSRLVVELSTGSQKINNMILMFQKEVAERLVSEPRTHEYSFLSVVVQSFWDVKKIVDAAPSDFYPAPRVDSRVVKLTRKAYDPLIANRDYISFIKRAFQFRRKYMIKSFGEDKAKILKLLNEIGYSEKVRAEEITVQDFQKLFKEFMRVQV